MWSLPQVERWTEVALEIFSRHKEMNRFDHAPSDHTHSTEHQTMLALGAEVEVAMRHCTSRASGDNGQSVTHTHHSHWTGCQPELPG